MLLVLALGAPTTQAQDLIATDRPGFGDGAALVPHRTVQAEAGYAYAQTGDVDQHRIGQVLARYGLFPNLELRVQLNSYVVQRGPDAAAEGVADVSGVEDARLGVKVGLLRASAPLTLLVTTSIPSGATEFTADDPQPEIKLAGDVPLTPQVAFSYNAGYLFTLGAGDFDQATLTASLGSSLPAVEGMSAYVGYGGFFADGFETDTHYLEGGVTYRLGDVTQFDVNAGIGLNGESPDYFIGVGLARRFDRYR
jgi:hypothetical protein